MRLDEAIVTWCDTADQAALAEGLGIDRAALTGRTATARAAALVTAAGRAGRSADLTAALAGLHPAVPWADLPTPHPTLHALHAHLCRRHSAEGLRDLCFRLGVDYDDLPGETKSGRARELVLWMEREGRAEELWGSDESGGDSDELRVTSDELGRRRWLGVVWRVAAVGVVAAGIVAGMAAGGARTGGEPAARQTRAAETPTGAAAETADEARAAVAPPEPTPTSGESSRTVATPGTAEPPPPVVVIGERGANLRRGPGAGYEVAATLRAGARLALEAVSPTGEWYQVRLPGRGRLWVDAGYATVGGGAGGVPVATMMSATDVPATAPAPTIPPATPVAATPARTRPAAAPPAAAASPTRTAAAPPPSPTAPPP